MHFLKGKKRINAVHQKQNVQGAAKEATNNRAPEYTRDKLHFGLLIHLCTCIHASLSYNKASYNIIIIAVIILMQCNIFRLLPYKLLHYRV